MITTKNQLKFYIAADRIMAGLPINKTWKEYIPPIRKIYGLDIIKYLEYMRKVAYYKNNYTNGQILFKIKFYYYFFLYRSLGRKLGFSIGYNVFGYGLHIPHYGTIVVNNQCEIGNFAVLHTSICIGGSGKKIGDGLYIGSGAMIMGQISLGNGCSIASQSLVNHNFGDNILLVGQPAKIQQQNYPFWYERDGNNYYNRVKLVNKLKEKYGIKE